MKKITLYTDKANKITLRLSSILCIAGNHFTDVCVFIATTHRMVCKIVTETTLTIQCSRTVKMQVNS